MKEADASVLFGLGGLSPLIGHRPQGGSGETGRNLQTSRRDRSLSNLWNGNRTVTSCWSASTAISTQPGPCQRIRRGRIAYVDRIKFIPIAEESVATMALLNKEIDFLQYVPFKNVEKFQKEYSQQGIVLDSRCPGSPGTRFSSAESPSPGI